ncbi:TPA: TrbC/VirB2 family protein [Legionella pneumophila]|nr:TrbC/VirB2 family protein [Legionella pneumophila]HAT1761284.1 TrbC/VirB2 family protein [Legionella pneumophila]HAT1763300.1 TrbC/VirB2 family protein [Legionella pneumophila]HAT1766369.1 TrbC/VirB2 family protein [Legionella pneumophila]HAT1812210.1 TrbC/VirB2 family protein [Legionella pneumophila]
MNTFQKVQSKISLAYWGMVCGLLPATSHAKSIEGIIDSAARYLQGGLARSVGVLCIIIAGYLCLYRQRFPKEYFSMILVGLGIIFGGSTLYNTFFA